MKKLLHKAKNLSWTILDQGMVSGVNFAVGILIARFLGVKEFGIFSLLLMAILFVQSIQKALIITPMMSLGPKIEERERNLYYQVLTTQQLAFSFISSLLLYLGMILSDLFFPQWEIIDYAFYVSLTLFLSQNQDFFRRVFFVNGKVIDAFFNDLISYGGRLILLVIIFLTSETSLIHVFAIICFTLFLSGILGYFMLFKPSLNYLYNIKIIKRHWRLSRYLIGSALLQWTSGNYFIIVAGILFGPTSVGILRAAGNIIGITNVILQGLENIIPQSASRQFMELGLQGLKSYLFRVFIYGIIVIASIALMLGIFSETILVLLYGDDLSGYGFVLIWYAVNSVLAFSAIPLFIGLRTFENTKPLFISYCATSIFSIFSAKLLLESFGINGVLFGLLANTTIILLIAFISFMGDCKSIEKKEQSEGS